MQFNNNISVAIGSEPETYFVGSREELFEWYGATAGGLLDSSRGHAYRMGGLTVSSLHLRRLNRASASLSEEGDVLFESATYPEPITQSWIQYVADTGLPLNFVALHQFDASPVPGEGAYWTHARRDVSNWLASSGYNAESVELLIEDFPQWSSYESNDSEYFASHMASGILSMLDLSLRGGEPVRPLQAFLYDYGFRPEGNFTAGFTGRPGLSNEYWIIKPVFNMNSLLAELQGVVTPVISDDPFVEAVGAVDTNRVSILISHHVPRESQASLEMDGTKFSILSNHFSPLDLSGEMFDRAELLHAFFDSTVPTLPEFIEALFAAPSSVQFDLLSWPQAVKDKWSMLQNIGQAARGRRSADTVANIHLEEISPGNYRLEHFVIDSQHANTYQDRESLQLRLDGASEGGMAALVTEILAINDEYDAGSGLVTDRTVSFENTVGDISITMEQNSVHLIRLSAIAE